MIRNKAISAFTEGDMKGTNVIVPTIGDDFDRLMDTYIKPFEKAGYRVKVKYVDAQPNESISRAATRALKTGRIIASSVLFGYGTKPKEVYERLAPMINSKGETYGYDVDTDEEKAA